VLVVLGRYLPARAYVRTRNWWHLRIPSPYRPLDAHVREETMATLFVADTSPSTIPPVLSSRYLARCATDRRCRPRPRPRVIALRFRGVIDGFGVAFEDPVPVCLGR